MKRNFKLHRISYTKMVDVAIKLGEVEAKSVLPLTALNVSIGVLHTIYIFKHTYNDTQTVIFLNRVTAGNLRYIELIFFF